MPPELVGPISTFVSALTVVVLYRWGPGSERSKTKRRNKRGGDGGGDDDTDDT